MLIPGLNKGVMHFSDFGSENVWTLTDKKGEIDDVWKIFSETIGRMEWAVLFIGCNYFRLKRIACVYPKNIILSEHIKAFQQKGIISGKRLELVTACIKAVVERLSGSKVRIRYYYSEFEIIGQDRYDELRQSGEENSATWLFSDWKGFCRVSHQKRSCKLHRENQCIFLRESAVLDPDGQKRKMFHCGKFNQDFRMKKIELLKAGKIEGTIGECDRLFGFEF